MKLKLEDKPQWVDENIFHRIQRESIIKLWNIPVGRAELPTGTGKTRIESALIAEDILEKNNSGVNFGIYIVTCPRIILTTQLMIDTQTTLGINLGIITNSIIVNSSNTIPGSNNLSDFSKEYIKKVGVSFPFDGSTTTIEKIEKQIKLAKLKNVPLVIYANYQSSKRIATALRNLNLEADVVLNDEAHFLVSSQYRGLFANDAKKLIEEKNKSEKATSEEDNEINEIFLEISEENIVETTSIPCKRRYFFTATEKRTIDNSENGGSGEGNNNIEIYGPLVVKQSMLDVINTGLIVRPELAELSGILSMPDSEADMGALIKKTADVASKKLKEDSSQELKLLVNTGGTKYMEYMLKSSELKQLIDEGYNIAMASSHKDVGFFMKGSNFENHKDYPKNDKSIDKTTWLNILKDVSKNQDAKIIVLHHKILTVGIDVQGFNSVLMLYAGDRSYFFQSVGRVLRIVKEDREAFRNKQIRVFDNTGWVKPYGLIIVPTFLQEVSASAKNSIKDLISDTLMTSEQVSILDTKGSEQKEDPLEIKEKEKLSLIMDCFEELSLDSSWMNNLINNIKPFGLDISKPQKVIDYLQYGMKKYSKEESNSLQWILTGKTLINDLLSKVDSIQEKEIAVLFNLEIVCYLIENGVNTSNITFYSDCDVRKNISESLNIKTIDIEEKFKGLDNMKKFDLIVTNPPYTIPGNSTAYLDILEKCSESNSKEIAVVCPRTFLYSKSKKVENIKSSYGFKSLISTTDFDWGRNKDTGNWPKIIGGNGKLKDDSISTKIISFILKKEYTGSISVSITDKKYNYYEIDQCDKPFFLLSKSIHSKVMKVLDESQKYNFSLDTTNKIKCKLATPGRNDNYNIGIDGLYPKDSTLYPKLVIINNIGGQLAAIPEGYGIKTPFYGYMNFNSLNEAQNHLKFLKSIPMRFIAQMIVAGNKTCNSNYMNILPMPDFSNKDCTDDFSKNFFNLTDEEMELIDKFNKEYYFNNKMGYW